MSVCQVFSPRARSASAALIIGALTVALAVSHLAGQAQPAPSLQLLSREGRRSLPLSIVGNQEMLALGDLANAFQLDVRDDGGAITVGYRGRTVVLTPDQTIASVAGRLISLPVPPTRSGSQWLVPLDFVNRALASIYDTRLELRRTSHLLIIGDVRVPRVAIRQEALGAAGRITLDVSPSSAPAISQQGNARLVVRFDADALDLTMSPFQPSAFVQAVRSLDATTIAVELGPRFSSFRSATQPIDDGLRVTIDVTGEAAETTAAPAAPPAPPVAENPPPNLTITNPGLIRTVAIDAGHGGTDIGAKGVGGVQEKDIALAVARRLKAVLENRLGVRVVMTRDTDRDVPLESRTAIANNNKADLFVSLHVNASFRPETSGAAVYVAAFRDADLAGGQLGAERMPVFGGGSRSIEVVRWNLAQIPHRDESDRFARLVAAALSERVPVAPRPIEYAPLRVLEAANMPAVLLEMGYVSNADQEKALAGGDMQAAVTQALLDAVSRLRASAVFAQTEAP